MLVTALNTANQKEVCFFRSAQSKICFFLDPLCSSGHMSTWSHVHMNEKIQEEGPDVNKHPDQQGRLSTTESPLIHQAINTNSFKTSLYLHEKNVKKKANNDNNNETPLETFFNWDTKVYNPSHYLFSCRARKNTVTNLENNSLCLFQNEPVPKRE